MGKLGRYEYPEITLEEAVDIGRLIANDWAGEITRSSLAKAMKMSERGGAFAGRLGGARLWGVCTGRGMIRLTDNGLRAAKPRSPEEAEQTRSALATSVPLFNEVAKRTNHSLIDERRLKILLEEITGANRLEIDRKISSLTRLTNQVLPYLQPAVAEANVNGSPELSNSDHTGSVVQLEEGERIEIVLPDGRLSVPESLAGLDAAMLMLQARRERLIARDRNSVFTPPERPF